MKYFLHVWNSNADSSYDLYNFLKENKDKKIEIIFFGMTEWKYSTKEDVFKRLLKHIKSPELEILKKFLNSEYYIITGLSKFNDVKEKVYFWDSFWFSKSYFEFQKNNLLDKELNLDYQYHYICLNGKERDHRSMFVDYLYKENLFQFGSLSWNKGKTKTNYKFKFWNPKILRLDITDDLISESVDSDVNNLLNNGIPNKIYGLQYRPPKQFYQSFMQIVTETTISKNFITEKTIIPILLKKPFLILSSQNFHKILTNYGFKLYDEIFDYNFDSLPSVDERINGLIFNIKKITESNLVECKDLYFKILDKINFNKELAITIAKDTNLVPKVYLENDFNDSFLPRNFFTK